MVSLRSILAGLFFSLVSSIGCAEEPAAPVIVENSEIAGISVQFGAPTRYQYRRGFDPYYRHYPYQYNRYYRPYYRAYDYDPYYDAYPVRPYVRFHYRDHDDDDDD